MRSELPARANLEYYRKEAKRLVAAYRAGEDDSVERVERTLGVRARARFALSDAQWVIAVERGCRSWADFTCLVSASSVAPDGLARAFEAARARWGERGEVLLDSGLAYGGDQQVRILVRKRQGRYLFSDEGAAVAAAGRPHGWLEVARRVVDDHSLNVNRRGCVFVPAVVAREAAWLQSLVVRVAETSVALYSALLELDDAGEVATTRERLGY
jgi:hypothetical protein